MYVSPQPNKSTNVRFVATLKTSHPFFIRDLNPEDQTGLLEGFRRLSEDSRYNRFLGLKSNLSPYELSYLCTPDNLNHFALLGYTMDQGIGVARCVRDKTDPLTAEFALTIIDPFQQLGAGTFLFERLAHIAKGEGITHFIGYVFAHNRKVIGFMKKYDVSSQHVGEGILEMKIDLASIS